MGSAAPGMPGFGEGRGSAEGFGESSIDEMDRDRRQFAAGREQALGAQEEARQAFAWRRALEEKIAAEQAEMRGVPAKPLPQGRFADALLPSSSQLGIPRPDSKKLAFTPADFEFRLAPNPERDALERVYGREAARIPVVGRGLRPVNQLGLALQEISDSIAGVPAPLVRYDRETREGAPPLGSIYTPSPGEGGAIRLPYATTGEDGSALPPARVFDRRTGMEPGGVANAVRRDVLRGTFNQGKRITQDDVNQAIAAGYDVQPFPVATARGDAASPATRSDMRSYKRPDGSRGYLINLAADGSDILQVEQNVLHGYASARDQAMEKRAPRDERYFEPTPSPVIQALRDAGREDLIDEVRTPKDLRRYEGLGAQSRWRKLIKKAGDPYTTKRSGNIYERTVPPAVEIDGRESRAATGDMLILAARDQQGQYGTMRVDPLETVFSREIDPDSTAAWERQQDVSLAKLIGELNDKYKTPAFKGLLLGDGSTLLRDGNNSPVDSFTPRKVSEDIQEGDSLVGSIRRTVRIDKNGVVDPVFQGLDLPEVRAAVQSNAALPAHLQTYAVQAELPVYNVLDRKGRPTELFRVGLPAKRNTDALLGELGRVTGGKYAQTIQLSTPERVARFQEEDHRNYGRENKGALQKASDLEILQAKEAGYALSEPDENGMIAYSSADGSDAGYLIPRTTKKKGGGNSGVQIPAFSGRQERWIKVPKQDWDKGLHSSNFQGVGLLSDQPGVRRFVEKDPRLNPEGWSTLELLDAIASYQGADYAAAPITGGFEQFASPVVPGVFDIALGAGSRTPTSTQRLLDATQTLANRAYYVQPAIPGALKGVQSAPWLRRREPQGPSLGEVMERAARSGQYASSAVDPSQPMIPGFDPDSIPRALPDPTLADYDAAMRSKVWAERVRANPNLALNRTLPVRSVTPLEEVLARPEMREPEMQFDPEELGLEGRQPVWSDFVDTSEGGNAGYGVVRLPVNADPSGGRSATRAVVDATERVGSPSGPYAGSNYYGLGGDASAYQQPMTMAGAMGGFNYGAMAEGLGATPGTPEHTMAMAQLASRVAARRRATAAGSQRTVTPQMEQMGLLP
jgi:hypothetical protein